jgi:uncharacterized protein (DUF433 family)
MPPDTPYKYIGRRYGSRYRQFFINDTKHRAENMWAETLGDDARTPEQVAADFEVPVDAVYECIHYCENNPDVLQQDYEMEQETLRNAGLLMPPGSRPAP